MNETLIKDSNRYAGGIPKFQIWYRKVQYTKILF